MENVQNYICDDRIYGQDDLVKKIKAMSDEEFAQYLSKLKEQENR